MTSTSSKPQEKPSSTPPKTKKPQRPNPTAHQKAQAVLSLWTECSTGSELCRRYKINWTTLSLWQDRALEGMLQALEPQVKLTEGKALSPRLQALLQKQQRSLDANKIASRLEQLQNKIANPPPAQAQATP